MLYGAGRALRPNDLAFSGEQPTERSEGGVRPPATPCWAAPASERRTSSLPDTQELRSLCLSMINMRSLRPESRGPGDDSLMCSE